MIVYRLARQTFIHDLSGYGAEKTGGRWNSKGRPVLYTAASRALAMVEVAVHVPLGIIPVNFLSLRSIFLKKTCCNYSLAIYQTTGTVIHLPRVRNLLVMIFCEKPNI